MKAVLFVAIIFYELGALMPVPPCIRASIYGILKMAFSLLPCFGSTLSALLEEEQNVCPDTKLIPRINETLAAPGYYQAANGEVSIEQFGQPRLPQSIDEPLLAMQMSSTAPISMPLAPGCDEECLTTALTRGYMSLDSALYPQTGAMIPSYNTEASKLGFFNGSGGNSNGMVVLDMNDIGEYQRMIEGEGLTRTYSDTDSMQGGYSNTAEIQFCKQKNYSNGAPPTDAPLVRDDHTATRRRPQPRGRLLTHSHADQASLLGEDIATKSSNLNFLSRYRSNSTQYP
ncbi:hypothetical protein ZWY2020_025441 [Hordeum vulgare]|nr:hypothetical protein ZWY2020_025441 [Hordeum vulgare]